MKVLVVGAGVFGLTVGERLAAAGHEVHILDRRAHLGGNAYSEFDPETGIEIHKYGAHLFHTSNAQVWAYVNRFTEFTDYTHRVWTEHAGALYPLPFNLATLSLLLGRRLTPTEGAKFLEDERAAAHTDNPDANLETKALSLIGKTMYEAFVRDYTAKQWETDPKDLPASLITRLPFRLNFDSRYFSDSFQGQPRDGYAAWFDRMVENPRITVSLNTAFEPDRLDEYLRAYDRVVYSGPVDAFFGYSEGHLRWRTVDFQHERLPVGDYQGCAVLNYADRDNPYTRTIEFRHFNPERAYPEDQTLVAHESSRWALPGDEPYYPVNSPEDRRLMARYRQKMEDHPAVIFGGRLGSYTYLDMHMAIASALSIVRNKF